MKYCELLIFTRFIYSHYQNDKYNARKRIRTKSPWVNIILSSFSLVTSGLSTKKGIILFPYIERSSKTVVKYCTAWYLEQKPTKIKDLIHNVFWMYHMAISRSINLYLPTVEFWNNVLKYDKLFEFLFGKISLIII